MILLYAFGVLAAALVLAPSRRDRARAGMGLAAFGLGVASLLAPADNQTKLEMLVRAAADAGAVRYMNVTVGLLVLGAATVALAAWRSPAPLAAAWALWVARPLFAVSGLLSPFAVAIGTATVAISAWALLRHLPSGRGFHRLDELLLDRRRVSGTAWVPGPDARPWVLIAVVGTAIAAFSSNAYAVLGGGVLSIGAVLVAVRRDHRPGWLGFGLAGVVMLLLLIWLFFTLSGGEGASLVVLSLGPISPAAETLIGLLLAAFTLLVCGLWPFHGTASGIVLAVVAGVILGRLAMVVPEGMHHWQPLVTPVLILGLWYSAARRDPASFLAGSGLLGIWSVDEGAIWGGGLLLGSSLMLRSVLSSEWCQENAQRVPRRLVDLLWIVPALAGWGVLEGLLRSQVVYGVVLVTTLCGSLALAGTGSTEASPTGLR